VSRVVSWVLGWSWLLLGEENRRNQAESGH
jgi:hypothetical protein